MAKFEAKRAVDMSNLHEFKFMHKDDQFDVAYTTGNNTKVYFYPNDGKEYIIGRGDGLQQLGGQLIGTLDSVTAYDKKKEYTISGFEMDASKFVDKVAKSGIQKLLKNEIMAGADTIDGSKDDDKLLGYSGNDLLNGSGGTDKLDGGGGNDSFKFTVALGGDNLGKILDFGNGDDKFELSQSIFTALGAPGTINPEFFTVGTQAADANDYLIYDQSSGKVYYDADGNGGGAQIEFAKLKGNPTLEADDFFVI